jgi:hypothetical protein
MRIDESEGVRVRRARGSAGHGDRGSGQALRFKRADDLKQKAENANPKSNPRRLMAILGHSRLGS